MINSLCMSCIPWSLSSFPLPKKIGRRKNNIFVRNQNVNENSNAKRPIIRIRVPNALIARTVVALFGLAVIDAGYSGDWSRIGAISRETEELMKVAAYAITPLCLLLIFSFYEETGKET